jgi:hypothetical protein
MYTLKLPDIAKLNLADAPSFVEFWGQFYKDDIKIRNNEEQRIDYFAELNIGDELSEENVRRLLRWKDSRFLTDPREKTGERNPSVVKVLNNLSMINKFRNGQISESEMRSAAEQVFKSGNIVWRAFLLHIAKPHTLAIADRNVFRVHCLHTGEKTVRD